jgi:hypothetical protein
MDGYSDRAIGRMEVCWPLQYVSTCEHTWIAAWQNRAAGSHLIGRVRPRDRRDKSAWWTGSTEAFSRGAIGSDTIC